MSSPAQVFKGSLIKAGLVSAAMNGAWPCYINAIAPEPDNCVCCVDTGAEKQGRIMRTGEVIEKPMVQVQVRGRTFTEGWDKAAAIKAHVDVLLEDDVTVGSDSFVIHSVRRNQSVLPIGAEPDGKRRELFTLNILLTLRTAT